MANKYLHLFNTTEEFEAAYNGNNYEEPWVSLVTATGKVDYNRSPYFGKGLVFDMSQSGDGNWFWEGGSTIYKLVYDDSIPFAEIKPNPFEGEYDFVYQFDTETYNEHQSELNNGFNVTIINAKSIDPELDDTIDLTMTWDGSYIGGDDHTGYKATLSNGRKIWIVAHSGISNGSDYFPGFFLLMKQGY